MSFHSGCPLPLDQLVRVIAGILADEISKETRRSPPIGETLAWDAQTPLDEDGVGLDSLVRLQAAGRVADFFALRDVGYEDYLLVRKTLGDWARIVEMSWAVKHETVTFKTSGSTGPSKACTHPFAHMVTEAVTLARIAGQPKRIVSLVAPHHIYGFLHTVVSASALGLECVDLRAVAPGSRLRRLRDDDLVVATPYIWNMLAEEAGGFEGQVIGMTSTAPMSAQLADRLADKGLSRLIEIYGSSETSGVGWRSDLREAYELLPWWRRSYERIARADAEAVALPDVCEWIDERRLRPVRREDGAVQIAGVNVYPARVAEAIRRHPGVADCVVRRSTRSEVSRLEAFVVVSDGALDADETAREISQYCARELSAPERPAHIAVGRNLPLDEMGKPTAW